MTSIEGDILVRDSNIPGGLDQTAFLDPAHLADQSRLWPSGMVDTFPAANKKIVLRAMESPASPSERQQRIMFSSAMASNATRNLGGGAINSK